MAFITIVLMGFLFLCPADLLAKTMYITDRIEIGLRSGTGLEYRILGRVRTGDRVEVLQSERNWSKVRLTDGTVGWINTSFLVDQIRPSAGEDSKGQEELKEAKETILALSREKETLLQEKARLIQEAEEAKALARTLQQDKTRKTAPELADLQNKYQDLEKEASSLRQKLAQRPEGEKGLRNREQLVWFSAGALVLLVGLVFGLILGRSRRKTRRYY